MSKFNLSELMNEEEKKEEAVVVEEPKKASVEVTKEEEVKSTTARPKERRKAEPAQNATQDIVMTSQVILKKIDLTEQKKGRKKAVTYNRVRLTVAVPEKVYSALEEIASGSKNDYIIKATIDRIEKEHPELKGIDWFTNF